MSKQNFFDAIDTDKTKYSFIEQVILHFTERDFLKQDIVLFCFVFPDFFSIFHMQTVS